MRESQGDARQAKNESLDAWTQWTAWICDDFMRIHQFSVWLIAKKYVSGDRGLLFVSTKRDYNFIYKKCYNFDE